MNFFKKLTLTLGLITAMSPAFASQTPQVDAHEPFLNLLPNPGFENGKYGWTASGGATATVNTTAAGQGSFGYDWDSNSAAQTLQSANITIPKYLYGKNGVVYCSIATPSGTATHTLTVNNGTTDIVTAQTIQSTTTFSRTTINFVFPTSGTIRLKLASVASNEPEVYIDSCLIGEANNVAQYQQISPWTTFTPTGAWSSNTTYTGKWRRVGDQVEVMVLATTSGAPTSATLTVNLPSGLTIDTNKIVGSGTDTQSLGWGRALDFGVQNYPLQVVYNSSSSVRVDTLNAASTYLIGSPVTQAIPFTFGASDSVQIWFMAPIAGWSADTVLRPDIAGNAWTAYTPTGGWNTNVTYTGFYRCDGDTLEVQNGITLSGAPNSATLTVNLPSGFTIDTAKMVSTDNAARVPFGSGTVIDSGVNAYPVSVNYQSTTSVLARTMITLTGSNPVSLTASSGANVTQAQPVTFGASDSVVLYYRVPVTAGSPCSFIRAPLLVGSVTSGSSGLERVERAVITTSSSPTASTTSSSWISSLSGSTGNTTITLAAGTFATAPVCVCGDGTAGGLTIQRVCTVYATSATSLTMYHYVMTSGSATLSGDGNTANIICIGPR